MHGVMVRRGSPLRRAGWVVPALLACACAAPSPAAAIDPLAPGPDGVRTVEYAAGSLRFSLPGTRLAGPIAFEQPLEGSITYPEGPAHGRCCCSCTATTPPASSVTARSSFPSRRAPICCAPTSRAPAASRSRRACATMPATGTTAVLASHGYAVVSPSANVVNSTQAASPDLGATPRAEIIGATLDLLLRWNNGTGPVVPGRPERTVATKLTGRLELEHVGLMGHSRGGRP
jgi:hypothetical protein